ncbi:MAG: NAD(P)-dependent oxidoreductase [Nitrospirota bacterium]
MNIAIIGANGQVGREVCLFLSVMGVKVVPISRTELGGIFLERCGLPCRYGAIGNSEDAKRLLEGCDLVADFSHPHGLPAEVRPAVKSNIENALRWAPAESPYVYISTISAFGMLHSESKIKNYRLSHTMYAADKRYLERLALSGQGQRAVYVLRLGQVHGDLQRVSQEFMEEAAFGKVYFPFSVNTASYTVFCFTIAEALMNITLGKERPGRYTLVSTPPWTWGEVYAYWARQNDSKLELVTNENQELQQSGFRLLLNLGRFLLTPVIRFGIAHRELFMNYLLIRFPKMQDRMQAEYLRHKAAAEIAQGRREEGVRRKFWVGEVPGERLTSLSDSRLTMESATQAIRTIVASAVLSEKALF